MALESKLRSFTVVDLNKYKKFGEIQRSKGKKTGERLNELIEKEVKESDPNFKELNAVRSKDAPDIIIPNPFLMDQAHSLPKWEEYLMTLTGRQGNNLCMHLISLLSATKQFEAWTDHD